MPIDRCGQKCCPPFEYFFSGCVLMNNLSICHKIIKGIGQLISSPDFLESFRLGKHFTRRRKIDMRHVILYLFYHSGCSMNLNISCIREALPELSFPDVSKQALSKARKGISPELFRNLFHFSVRTFYSSCPKRKTGMDFSRLPSTVPAYRCPLQRIIFPILDNAAM